MLFHLRHDIRFPQGKPFKYPNVVKTLRVFKISSDNPLQSVLLKSQNDYSEGSSKAVGVGWLISREKCQAHPILALLSVHSPSTVLLVYRSESPECCGNFAASLFRLGHLFVNQRLSHFDQKHQGYLWDFRAAAGCRPEE